MVFGLLPGIDLPTDGISDGIGDVPFVDLPAPPDFGGGNGDDTGSAPPPGGDPVDGDPIDSGGGTDDGLGLGLSEAEAREVAYLYEAGLDRDGNIDLPGLNFWIDQRESGLSQQALATAFLNSTEFEAAAGPLEDLSDRDLVEVLYENVLDRPGEIAGIDFWTGQLAREGFGRADLLLAFADSPENLAGSPEIANLEEVSAGEWDFAG